MEVSASVSYFLPQFVVRVLLSLGNKIIEQEDTDGELEATVGEQNKIEEHDYLETPRCFTPREYSQFLHPPATSFLRIQIIRRPHTHAT